MNDHEEDNHVEENKSLFQMFLPAVISLILLLTGIILDYNFDQTWFKGWIRVGLYIVAYIPVGFPVLKEAFLSIKRGKFSQNFF